MRAALSVERGNEIQNYHSPSLHLICLQEIFLMEAAMRLLVETHCEDPLGREVIEFIDGLCVLGVKATQTRILEVGDVCRKGAIAIFERVPSKGIGKRKIPWQIWEAPWVLRDEIPEWARSTPFWIPIWKSAPGPCEGLQKGIQEILCCYLGWQPIGDEEDPPCRMTPPKEGSKNWAPYKLWYERARDAYRATCLPGFLLNLKHAQPKGPT